MKNSLVTKLGRREFMGTMVGGWSLLKEGVALTPGGAGAAASGHTFGQEGEHFLLDGKPFQIISGEIHYARVPREYWRDRLRKIRALGLNTICVYMFWNLHEPEPGVFNFEGNLDAVAFLRAAQEEGLWVLLRPGPYVCAEWDFGGLPSWLLATQDMKVRTQDPRFLEAARKYLLEAGRQLAPLQITRGRPILMMQVENEYGEFGKDKVYLQAIERMIRDAGFDVTLFTSNGSDPAALAGGTLPDALSVINFGDNSDPAREFANFAKSRQNVPRMCGEFWVGWFDHWGERHHVTPPAASARGLEWMLSQGISANLYMVHGGTSFGFMNGANWDFSYQPDISSYDYDSPLDEAGRPTPKFHALREVIRKHLPAGTELPALPEPLPMIEIPPFQLAESANLEPLLRDPIRSEQPQTMEAVGQSYGFILYRKKLEQATRGRLEIIDVHDYALVLQGAKRLGVLDRRLKQTGLEVELAAGAPLDILVENLGRTNYGPHMGDDRKGITERVTLAGKELTGWEIYRLPLADLSALAFTPGPKPAPAFYRGNLDLETVGDSFLDMRGWGKGNVWVNGHNLGRYWHIGPQQSLFVPAPWLKKGRNEVIVLDLLEASTRSLQGRKEAVWGNEKS
ncbi:MAG: beta-galactosidase [Terriglobia bacterium]